MSLPRTPQRQNSSARKEQITSLQADIENVTVTKVKQRQLGAKGDQAIAQSARPYAKSLKPRQAAIREPSKPKKGLNVTQELVGRQLADTIYDNCPKHEDGRYKGLANCTNFWNEYEETLFVSPEELARQKKELDELIDRVPTLEQLLKKNFTKE